MDVVAASVRRRLFSDCRYVALGGGAMLGTMYIGVLQALCDGDPARYAAWHKRLLRVAGTSAGAILALLVCAGMSPWEMQRLLLTVNLGAIMSDARVSSISAMLLRGAVCNGDNLDAVLRTIVTAACGTADVTLNQLPVPLVVAVTNAVTGSIEFWDGATRPHVPVWLALRASACVPGLFPAVVVDGVPYYDGGITCNLPCHLFPPRETLTLMVHIGGLHFGGGNGSDASAPGDVFNLALDALGRAFRIVQWYMCAAQLGPLRAHVDFAKRCVPCVALNSSAGLGPTGAFAFEASAATLQALVEDGQRSVHAVIVRDLCVIAIAAAAAVCP